MNYRSVGTPVIRDTTDITQTDDQDNDPYRTAEGGGGNRAGLNAAIGNRNL